LNGIKVLEKKEKDMTLDLVFHGCLSSMLSMLRFYTSGKETGWQESSLLTATSTGKGHSVAHSLHGWIWNFLEDNEQLPINLYCCSMSRIEAEDLASEICNHTQSLDKKYLFAMDIIDYLNQSEVQARCYDSIPG